MPPPGDAAHWHRLSAALDELLDLDTAEQGERLDDIARADPAFAGELRALLNAESGEGLFERGLGALAHEALEQSASASKGGTSNAASEQDAVTIGHWRLIEPLGRGGMGEVFLAQRHDGDFTQRAALKRLKRGMDSEDILQRFLQERRILASLAHPNIARLLDGGMDGEGRPYIVMEHDTPRHAPCRCSARLALLRAKPVHCLVQQRRSRKLESTLLAIHSHQLLPF